MSSSSSKQKHQSSLPQQKEPIYINNSIAPPPFITLVGSQSIFHKIKRKKKYYNDNDYRAIVS